jgi:hypothetical protein
VCSQSEESEMETVKECSTISYTHKLTKETLCLYNPEYSFQCTFNW